MISDGTEANVGEKIKAGLKSSFPKHGHQSFQVGGPYHSDVFDSLWF